MIRILTYFLFHTLLCVPMAMAQQPSSLDIPQLKEDCDANDGWSCSTLAFRYLAGDVVETDLAVSAAYAEKGCELGEVEACINLANALRNGHGIAQNNERATRHYSDICDNHNNTFACVSFADSLRLGRGIDQDYGRAGRLYLTLCNAQNEALACTNYGYLIGNGFGVEKNKFAAFEYAEKACRLGSAIGCANTANYYKDGIYVSRDMTKARAFLRRACDLGDEISC